LITQGEKRKTSTKTYNETMMRAKFRVFVSRISPPLAARETCVAETNFAARKQKLFLPEVRNIFVSRTQILRPQHMFPCSHDENNVE